MDIFAEAKQLFLAGLECQEKGELEKAEHCYRQALELAPERPSVMNNLAAVLLRLQRYGEARSLCEKLLAMDSKDAEAILNSGNCQLALKSPAEALRTFDAALLIKPDYVEAHIGRSSALIELHRPAEALAGCDQALANKPDYAEALNNRGNALRELERHAEALASYDRALAVKPGYAEALYNRGSILRNLERHDEALASLDRALAIRPGYVEALNNRGIVLWDLKRRDEALASLDRALAIEPDYAEALYNRGNWLMMLEHYADAIDSLDRLLGIDPEWDYALGHLVHCKMHICAWHDLAQDLVRLRARVQAGKRAITPFPMLATYATPAEQLQCARTWVADKHPAASSPLWRGERYRHERVRLAYVSADLREHATSYLGAGLFELHDKNRFELYAIATGANDRSPMRERLERAFEHFMDVSDKPDREAAALLRELEIDILVDLNGYFGGARTGIFALRPAPVQVNYLGFPGTMGAEYIDYIIADRHVIPADQQQYFTEKVVCLPDAYQANDSRRKISAQTPTRLEAGLPEAGFVFCCFNNNHKITPEMFDVWMRLLKNVKESVLWLIQGNAAVPVNLRREAEARGVAPDRIVFAPRVDLADHLARHRLADLFLDTLPHNAHTTASDALWAGLPVLTCLGPTFAGRVAASLLNAVGLPELITQTREDYEALALKLAADGKLLGEIKTKLAINRTTHPLFNTDRFRRHIESAYVTMWERYQRGEPPASFAVPAAG